MFNRVIISEPEQNNTSLRNMNVGEVAVITSPASLKGRVVIVGYDRSYVLIDAPDTYIDSFSVFGRVLPKGTKIEFFTNTGMTPADEKIVRELYQTGRKIDAIKHVKSVTLLGLKEAKDMADQIGGTPSIRF